MPEYVIVYIEGATPYLMCSFRLATWYRCADFTPFPHLIRLSNFRG
jgi:hypothetical protein